MIHSISERSWSAWLVLAAAMTLVAGADAVRLAGLKAAGLTGTPPPNADLIQP